jgi:hypothetical protein
MLLCAVACGAPPSDQADRSGGDVAASTESADESPDDESPDDESPDENPVERDTGPPTPPVVRTVPRTGPVELEQVELAEQAQEVRDTRFDLQALEFYLVDQRAQQDGQIPATWKQPPLETYKAQPWCHAPEPHGDHVPPTPDTLLPDTPLR